MNLCLYGNSFLLKQKIYWDFFKSEVAYMNCVLCIYGVEKMFLFLEIYCAHAQDSKMSFNKYELRYDN